MGLACTRQCVCVKMSNAVWEIGGLISINVCVYVINSLKAFFYVYFIC